MNQISASSQPGESLLPSGIGTITTIHLVLMLLIAIAAVAVIVAGIRRKRLRKEATRQMARHAEDAGIEPPAPVDAAPAPAPAPEPEPEPEPAPWAEPTPAPVAPPTAMPPLPSLPADAPGDARPTLADEPIAAAAPFGASPAGEGAEPASEGAEPAGAAMSAAAGGSDPADGPVTQLKGLGPKVAARLAELGITRIGDLAALDDRQAATLDAQLGMFGGRMARDRWIEQARLLARGDRAGFEAVFGRL